MSDSIGRRLEKYTEKRPYEVLLVNVQIGDVEDQIAIFRGFSSSLMNPTASDPDVPVLPENAKIVSIDRVASPYNPSEPRYIQKDLTRENMENLLLEVGI
ncbi:hypothetical protein NIES2119_19870 [[Phormidium ambiguum] IAM M-71]|uniref:DUF7734 domain-containing protein n=1 Tax=[Phormidium ambiguum] IAM M-71 TaxID=454136 RepID=A0A1U7IEZ2_9CYAN|nr:hypothetical protein [Phormidium ambiguum]OKH35520.1 hypothetical protein NIES2119_19870 [Phormidium ambiguum IAM M-71]